MNLFEKISQWFGLENNGAQSKEMEALQTALGKSNRLKYHGDYDQALNALGEARTLADKLPNQDYRSVVDFHRADIYTKQGNWQAAATLLNSLLSQTQETHNDAQRAYILTALGRLAQAQDQWDEARDYYERALALARSIKADGAEGRVQGYLADTYLREENDSFAVYLLENAFPKVNTRGEIEHSSYFAGRLGEALIKMGRRSEGQAYLGRALRLAEKMEYRDYEIRWRGEIAIQAMLEGQYAEARRHYLLVLAQANVYGAEDAYLNALCRVSKACLRLSEYDAGLDYARQALEHTESRDDSDVLRIKAMAAYGVAQRTMGKYADAIPPLAFVAARYDAIVPTPADYTYVDVLRNLAASQAEVLDYDTAIETYNKALAHAESHQNPMDVAGTHRDLGILYARRGAYDDAIAAWTKALGYYEDENQHSRVARLYCDIANIRKQLGQGKRARKDYEQALMLLNSIEDLETRGIVMSNAATAYVDQGDVESAEFFFVESIKIAQKLNDRHAEATRRGNYGWFLLCTGREKRAIATLEYALRQSENLVLRLQAAVQVDNIGTAFDELNEYDQAITYHRRALDLLKDLDSPYWEAIIQANLAHTLLALNQVDEASHLLEMAHATGTTLHRPEISIRVLDGKAKLALAQGDVEKASAYSDQAVKYARQVDTRRLLANTLITHSHSFAQVGDDAQAEATWAEAQELLKSLRIPLEGRIPEWIGVDVDTPTGETR